MTAVLLVILGLVALVLGAELVVRCGSRLARRMRIPPLVVGLTIVSLGTSAPELAVGIEAVRAGAGSLAVGNIVGTNIVNLLLILGLSALIRPIPLQLQILKLDLPAMAGAAVLLLAMVHLSVLSPAGTLGGVDGAVMIGLALVYTALLLWMTRRESPAVQREFADEYPAEPRRTGRGIGPTLLQLGLLIVGIVVIVLGADWLVSGAVELAQALGVSDAIIGLTVVAIGTSAPELATTMVSTFRGDRDIAVGNLIGSSTYNLTAILGASLVVGGGPIAMDPVLIAVDLPIMALITLVCVPVFLTGRMVNRLEGGALVAGYGMYLAYLILVRA